MRSAPEAFTAARLAAWLRRTPQMVRKSLRDVKPATVRVVNGCEASAWTVEQLPESLRRQLFDEAKRERFLTIETMLASVRMRWEPSAPMAKIEDSEIDAAQRLRQALKPWLSQQADLNISSGEMEARGVADYAAFFGHHISTRYWRELFLRTIQRDGGAADWNRLELYLSNNPKIKQARARLISQADAKDFAEIEFFIKACSNPNAPSDTEKRAIWTLALEKYAAMAGSGMPSKRAARRVRSFLFAKAPFLAVSRDALLKSFERKLQALVESAGDPKALRDGREENGERFKISDEDRDLLVHRAVFYYRGDVAPAWRDLIAKGFSEQVKARYAGNAACKSHVPKSVMDSVSSEVGILTVMHQGKRAFDSIKGHVDRNYDGIASLKCMSADDFTMPVYYYVPDGHGWFQLTRGQILIFLDFRTLRVLGWSMQPDRNYSSLTIRSLCTHVFAEFGLPAVLQFERGIWESSSLLKGRDPAPFEFTEVVQGLREFGIKFIHSIRPRSKTVERVGGLLQDLMEAEPGYCGREERKDAPESLRKEMGAVAARIDHPSKYFFSYEQWNDRLGQIIARYNSEPQQGRILGGLSPDDALLKFADREDPPMQFSSKVRFLLAHDKRPAPVTLNGVTMRVGKKKFNYRGAEIAHLVGKDVLAWFDPENPESIVVTDMNRRNPICVKRSQEPDALECLTDPDGETLAREMQRIEGQASYMKARFNVLKSKLPLPQRQTLVDAQTLELGQRIEEQRVQISTAKSERQQRTRTTQERARALGLPTRILNESSASDEGTALMLAAKRANERTDSVPEEPL
jgi:hypothetical protein